jgi:photosystem II stability/assembly factor-like uncharacterized protein
MKSSFSISIATLIFVSLMLCLPGCGVKADHREKHSVTQQTGAITNDQPPPIHKVLGDPTMVQFVAESTQAPELYSRGSYIDEKHAWVAAGFKVHRTNDGGRTWQLMQPSTESESVFGKMGGKYVTPSFITISRGWLNAGNGTWQTEDGGTTWRRIFTEYTGNPHFADEQHGWIATYTEKYQQSYVTNDGGLSWQQCGAKRRLNKQTPHTAFFLKPQLGWAITSYTDDERRTIYGVAGTSDGGCSWQQLWTSDEDPDQKYCGIHFVNEKEGRLAGCYGNGNLIQTSDGGKTWFRAQTPIDAWRATPIEVYFGTSQEGWLLTRSAIDGNPEGLYRTGDGGRTWRQLSEGEIVGDFRAGERNQIPVKWAAGRLFQMLYASKVGAHVK